ncbi:hypothetical protein HS088_TW04G01514 [Tripterygium wilfordii]|uniref:Uncharacterized protein n=1 Tax=Tripterygium wilfordii TaxID=458696 RepID=A0A7J7DT50_TRIWF|nr:hypothetical protein HS088_TW04G01514 [Tripterygium wilfordii]
MTIGDHSHQRNLQQRSRRRTQHNRRPFSPAKATTITVMSSIARPTLKNTTVLLLQKSTDLSSLEAGREKESECGRMGACGSRLKELFGVFNFSRVFLIWGNF